MKKIGLKKFLRATFGAVEVSWYPPEFNLHSRTYHMYIINMYIHVNEIW